MSGMASGAGSGAEATAGTAATAGTPGAEGAASRLGAVTTEAGPGAAAATTPICFSVSSFVQPMPSHQRSSAESIGS